jgi:hypothetical protein
MAIRVVPDNVCGGRADLAKDLRWLELAKTVRMECPRCPGESDLQVGLDHCAVVFEWPISQSRQLFLGT